jgi:hypothetical protein
MTEDEYQAWAGGAPMSGVAVFVPSTCKGVLLAVLQEAVQVHEAVQQRDPTTPRERAFFQFRADVVRDVIRQLEGAP